MKLTLKIAATYDYDAALNREPLLPYRILRARSKDCEDRSKKTEAVAVAVLE